MGRLVGLGWGLLAGACAVLAVQDAPEVAPAIRPAVPQTVPTTMPPASEPTTIPIPVPPAPTTPVRTVWDDLAGCLTDGDWTWNRDVAMSGGLKLLPSELPDAWTHTRDEQIAAAEAVYARRGWGRWSGCARQLGFLTD